jgi:hypothetical protein
MAVSTTLVLNQLNTGLIFVRAEKNPFLKVEKLTCVN